MSNALTRTSNPRADGASVAWPLFQADDDGSQPISALQLRFGQINRQRFAALNKRWHSRLPLIGASQFRAIFGAECGGEYYAVAAWSNPVARLLPQTAWMELRRFAIAPEAPKNTASRMLGWMVRELRKKFPELVRLISYQDCDVHVGTIYKASGWKHAENYISRSRGWESTKGGGRHRVGRTNQATAPRMRWELAL